MVREEMAEAFSEPSLAGCVRCRLHQVDPTLLVRQNELNQRQVLYSP